MVKTKSQILEEMYRDHSVERYVLKLANELDKQLYEDIVGELYLMLCELNGEVVEEIYNGCGKTCFQRYVFCIVKRQVHSKNSKIYWQYKRHIEITIPSSQINDFDRIWEESERNTT